VEKYLLSPLRALIACTGTALPFLRPERVLSVFRAAGGTRLRRNFEFQNYTHYAVNYVGAHRSYSLGVSHEDARPGVGGVGRGVREGGFGPLD
jgi:hypothetical protein